MSARVELYREQKRNVVLQDLSDGPVFRDKFTPGKWRWRFVSNGRIMADSGQGYSRRIDCLNGCATVLGGWIDPSRPDVIERIVVTSVAPVGTRIDAIRVVDLTREAKP